MFSLKKLREIEGIEEVKRSTVLRAQRGLQLSKTWMLRWKLIVLVK
jgi:hypothetical protein